jgi:asparagine synthase
VSLEPLELALGLPLGADAPGAMTSGGPGDPLAALEAAVLEALRRPPCLVSFSGGRDSSAVLAVAVRVARREGLPDPVPASIRARGAPAAQESRWQELVVRHLGVGDWLRPEFGDELDLVGPVAARALRRHGLLWPFNAHFHIPLLEAARGGSLLTGIGGDELFRSATTPRAAAVLSGRVRPAAADARRAVAYLAPRGARRRWHARRGAERVHPWLTDAGDEAGRRALGAWEAAEPRRLPARMAHVRAARYLGIGTASLERLARDSGAAIHHPLLEEAVWAAVARSAPAGGHLGRTRAMTAVFGPLLPDELLARKDKASFDEVFFHDHSRAFAERWSGAGAPAGLVDAGALREHWRGELPRAQSFSLLQAAWLSSEPNRLRGSHPAAAA